MYLFKNCFFLTTGYIFVIYCYNIKEFLYYAIMILILAIVIFIIVGLPITLFSLPLMTEAFIGGLLFLFLGGNFLFWGVRILIFSLRRGVKKIYIRPESISKPKPKSQPKSKSKKKSKLEKAQIANALQGDSVVPLRARRKGPFPQLSHRHPPQQGAAAAPQGTAPVGDCRAGRVTRPA